MKTQFNDRLEVEIMERTTKKERKANANSFYHLLSGGYSQKAAIIIQRQESKTNPCINRCQFITSHVNGPASEVVIAESLDGVAGCFRELISNIYGAIPQINYFEDGFKAWLRKTCHMDITWNDGLVIMLEYKTR